MRKIGWWIMVVGVVMLLCPPIMAARAQGNPLDSATFTEAFINAQIQANQRPNADLTNLYINLQPGQLVMSGTVQSAQGSLDLALTLVPSVSNGRLNLEATVLTIGGFPIDLSQWTDAGTVGDLQNVISSAAENRPLESLTVTENDLTVTWRRADPDGPALNIVDTSVSLTFTEAYYNALPGVQNPPGGQLSDVYVNFQPGQVTISGTYTPRNGPTAPLIMTAVPTLFNGLVTWTVTAMQVNNAPLDAQALGQMNDDIAGSWRMFFTGLYRAGALANLILTEDTVTLTWDSSVQNEVGFDVFTGSIIVTEEYINNTYRVTHPRGYSINNVVVDLQPGQVVINANLNLNNGNVLVQRTVFVPSVENGMILWTIAEATLDGEPLDPAIIARFNESVIGWWNWLVWSQVSDYTFTNVRITDTQIEISARGR
jgi:hypothetical protein